MDDPFQAGFEVGQAGNFLDQLQPLFAQAQRFVAAFLLRNVAVRTDRPDSGAILVAKQFRAARDPANFTVVRADDAVGVFEGIGVVARFFHLALQPVSIVGMD